MFSRLTTTIKNHRFSLLVLLGAWGIFFGSVFLRGHLFYLDDLKIIYYPLEHAYAEAQNNWQLPQWNHLFGFGQPLMAWGQLGFFTPLHVLLRLLQVHPLILLQISIASYFLIGLLGMYAYLQRQKLSQSASTLGAILFVFSGFTIGHLNHVNFYTSTMWLPYLLLTAHTVVAKPTLKHALLLTLVATATTISGQPQVILYTFIIATIISLAHFFAIHPVKTWKEQVKPISKTIGLTLLAATLTLGLSAHSIFPLAEFLPLTERNSPIPREQLLEFSYPPYHAITLIAPYFFGDHSTYWGPKSFQELAAFTGIIPLMLAGMGLLSWKTFRHLRLAALLLIIIATLFALGKYSPLYSYLIEEQFITTLNIPGRFVYFFNIGILLLASLGLNDLWQQKSRSPLTTFTALAFPLIILTPFFIHLQESAIKNQLFKVINEFNLSWVLFLSGVIVVIAGIYVHNRRSIYTWVISATTTITLLIFAIPYNPTTLTRDALTANTFTHHLQAYQSQTGLPARLYARENILIGGHQETFNQAFTDSIAPLFTVYQPLSANNTDECLVIPMSATPGNGAQMTISLHQAINSPAMTQTVRTESDIYHQPNQIICFPQFQNNQHPLFLKFSSSEPTTITLQIHAVASEESANQAYYVRVENPTAEQIERSQKPFAVSYRTFAQTHFDLENFLLVRHINVTASTSSARWIGALSIRPYRDFIEKFFANDQDNPIDGDGQHALDRHRTLVDMAGITHFTSTINQDSAAEDPFLQQNYQLVAEEKVETDVIRLYHNPQAYPKAYLAPRAEFKPAADEVRTALLDPTYDPSQLVYIDGPTPPDHLPNSTSPLTYQAHITTYTPTETTVDVTTDQEAVLVLTDTSTPHWQTYIDGQPAPYLTANSFFKTAIVPAGNHTVTFRYESPAIKLSNQLSLTALGVMIVLTGFTFYKARQHHA